MLKKYHCVDKFMIRVPAFPVNALKKISDFGADDSTKNFLNTLGNYEDYFLQSLYISSKSLYESVTSNKCDIRKNHNAMVALQKYFIRNCVRPTPFGLCSGVALGNFADKTDMCLDPEKYNLDVTVDFAWLLNIIAKMENDKNILNQLKIKWNKNCFVSGDRIKNPCFSGHGVEGRENLAFQEVNLKRTKLIDLIRKFSDYWIPYYKLTNLIQESYPSVPRGKIEDVLKSLLDNELLLTELRIPAYCADPLKHIFSIVEHKDVQIGYKEELIAIENILKKYRERPNLNLCKEIYSSMERLYPCKNYIEVNRGHFFRSASLSYQIKDKLESFAEFLSEVAVMPEEYSELNDFREKFIEEYGLGIEVPIFDVIDQNKFDGLHYISPAPIRSEREDKIRQIVDKKILFTILESKDEVKLSRTDFSGLENKNIESYSTSFDLNFYITFDKQSHKHSIVVGPNVGAAKSGMMFQRFKNVFNVEQFAEYNQCYRDEERCLGDSYINVEIRETIGLGRTENVINQSKNYEYFLPISCDGTPFDGEINLSDLVIGISLSRKLYIKSRKTGKICRFVIDNMRNPKFNSKLVYLLKRISDEYTDHPLFRLFFLSNYNYVYRPRISYENIIISLKTWKLSKDELDFGNLEEFKKSFFEAREKYKIDRFIYQCDSDNRMLLDLQNPISIEMLFSEGRGKKGLHLTEIEPNLLNGSVVTDQNNNGYVSEFTFSFILDKTLTKNNHIFESEGLPLLQDVERYIAPCMDGWIYFKLYRIGSRADELLTERVHQLLSSPNLDKFFFIRYNDKLMGSHLRIRLKYRDENSLMNHFKEINDWLQQQRLDSLVNYWTFDIYQREINRYGGESLIQYAENVFYYDSLFVIRLLGLFDITQEFDRDLIYFTGMLSIFKCYINDKEKIFSILDKQVPRNMLRDHYRRSRKKYLHIADKIFSDQLSEVDSRFISIQNEYTCREQACKKYFYEVNKLRTKGQLTNSSENILSSVIHMFCNRVSGNLEMEATYRNLLRHTMFDLYQRERHLIGKKSGD